MLGVRKGLCLGLGLNLGCSYCFGFVRVRVYGYV